MPDVTGLTAERMMAIEGASVVAGNVVGDDLILQKFDGTTMDAGNVRGPKGDTGPASIGIMAWPVGSIFLSVVPTNPNTLLGGGTWVAWGTGRVPIAVDTSQTEFDTVEETGGEKTHALTTAELASHTHVQNAHSHADTFAVSAAGAHDHGLVFRVEKVGATGTGTSNGAIPDAAGTTTSHGPITTDGSHTHGITGAVSAATATAQSAGSGTPHNNMPPYITCYMWKRTA